MQHLHYWLPSIQYIHYILLPLTQFPTILHCLCMQHTLGTTSQPVVLHFSLFINTHISCPFRSTPQGFPPFACRPSSSSSSSISSRNNPPVQSMDRSRQPSIPPTSSPICPAPTTTFVRTDQSTFKELVQRLTGPTSATSTDHQSVPVVTPRLPPSPTPPTGVKRPAFKPTQHRPKLTIVKPSPSMMNSFIGAATTAASAIVTNEGVINEEEEEKAIKERRFYLHPSPRSKGGEPELLTLFPHTSPKSREG